MAFHIYIQKAGNADQAAKLVSSFEDINEAAEFFLNHSSHYTTHNVVMLNDNGMTLMHSIRYLRIELGEDRHGAAFF